MTQLFKSGHMKKHTLPIVGALLVALLTGCSRQTTESVSPAPEITDLGVVEVSGAMSIHRDLGNGRACVITSSITKEKNVMLSIAIVETNSAGVVRTLATPRVQSSSGRQIVISVGDIGISLTPQIKQ